MSKFNELISTYLTEQEDDRPHYHLILRLEVEDMPDSEEECEKFIKELADTIGMEIVYGPKAVYLGRPGTEGYSAFAVITTSHISVHIWEKTEPPLMQVDIFSCNSFSKKEVMDYLESNFKILNVKDIFIDRTSAVTVKKD